MSHYDAPEPEHVWMVIVTVVCVIGFILYALIEWVAAQ